VSFAIQRPSTRTSCSCCAASWFVQPRSPPAHPARNSARQTFLWLSSTRETLSLSFVCCVCVCATCGSFQPPFSEAFETVAVRRCRSAAAAQRWLSGVDAVAVARGVAQHRRCEPCAVAARNAADACAAAEALRRSRSSRRAHDARARSDCCSRCARASCLSGAVAVPRSARSGGLCARRLTLGRVEPPGFPKAICTSVNSVAVHGIPDDRPLRDGDLVNIDVSLLCDGHYGDTAASVVFGGARAACAADLDLLDTARRGNAPPRCHHRGTVSIPSTQQRRRLASPLFSQARRILQLRRRSRKWCLRGAIASSKSCRVTESGGATSARGQTRCADVGALRVFHDSPSIAHTEYAAQFAQNNPPTMSAGEVRPGAGGGRITHPSDRRFAGVYDRANCRRRARLRAVSVGRQVDNRHRQRGEMRHV
jgi:hypothetical protein